MRTIKSIIRKHNKDYKLNYDATLSRNNIGFFIADSDTQYLDDEKENIDRRNLDVDLDFIDIKLLVNDYKIDILNEYQFYHESELDELSHVYLKDDIAEIAYREDLKNFHNIIDRIAYKTLRKKIEAERNIFIKEKKIRIKLLNIRERISRYFKYKKIKEIMEKKCNIEKNLTLNHCNYNITNYHYNNKLYALYFYRYLSDKVFDEQKIEELLLFCLEKSKIKVSMNYDILEENLHKYAKNHKNNEDNESIEKIFKLLNDEFNNKLKKSDEIKNAIDKTSKALISIYLGAGNEGNIANLKSEKEEFVKALIIGSLLISDKEKLKLMEEEKIKNYKTFIVKTLLSDSKKLKLMEENFGEYNIAQIIGSLSISDREKIILLKNYNNGIFNLSCVDLISKLESEEEKSFLMDKIEEYYEKENTTVREVGFSVDVEHNNKFNLIREKILNNTDGRNIQQTELKEKLNKQALISEINEKSNQLKSLRKQRESLEKQRNTDNRAGWIRVE